VKKRLVPYNVVRDTEPPAQRQLEIKTLWREELATFPRPGEAAPSTSCPMVVAAFKAHRRRQLEERMAKGAS
jgi:hypothetical protein